MVSANHCSYAEAAAAGKGVVLVDGRLIENLHVENARRLVAVADEIARLPLVDEGQPGTSLR
jgi:citrate lyase beta subunit